MSSSDSISRRALLKTAALGASAACLPQASLAAPEARPHAFAWPENGTLIPDEGWHLWVDTKAHWESDDIFLPEDVAWVEQDGKRELCGKGRPLPVNEPTGGWSVLTPATGLEVMLPTSVGQHFWGKYGAGVDGKPRPYTPEEYRYASTASGAPGPDSRTRVPSVPPADDDVPQNGAYFGVSWFYRTIDIPASMQGKRIFLHVRGAHLRAEVYLNGKLCGYSIMEELPFEADLTAAAKPGGENQLAIRITNPFGRFDWVDGLNAKWGKVSLYRSHGFGALDRGISISTHDAVRITDIAVLNTPNPKHISIKVEIEQIRPDDCLVMEGELKVEVLDPASGTPLPSKGTGPGVGSGCERGAVANPQGPQRRPNQASYRRELTAELTCDSATLWDVASPQNYHLRVTWLGVDKHADTRTIAFGFRSFTTPGIDTDAMFRLNGRRIRIYTSISWGFWGLNGMFPVPELAEKEVRAAQALGLNCLNFHRNLAKEDVLRKHDELGVLRYLEPGAGKMAIGKLPAKTAANAPGTVMEDAKTDAEKFAQRFMFVKCVEMVKAFRSHPSVIEYCLQNEIGADLKNPATLAILKAMHDEDPSRCVVLNDGFVQRGAAQAWYEPWTEELQTGERPSSHLASGISNLHEGKLHRSDEEKAGGWWNDHQGAGDQWYDQFYKSPTSYTYRAPYKDVLTEYGEMEGCARPDNHPLMVHQIETTYAKYGKRGSDGKMRGQSYDLADHEEIIASYERFLDSWGFRKAFPTSEHVFKAVGRTCYESWMNYMENARISDELDFAAISGWESTAIENHSGIVDNLRNFKSDPELIRGSLLPVRPIAKQRSLVIEQGKPATFDLFLANDTTKPATGTLTFTMITPSGKRQQLISLPVPQQRPDIFSYLLKEAFETPALTEEGLYRFKFAISSLPLATQTKELWVTGLPAVLKTYQAKPAHPDPHTIYDMVVFEDLKIAVSGVAPALRDQLLGLRGFGKMGEPKIADYKPGEHYDLIITSGINAHTKAEGQVGETTGESMPVMKPGHTPEPGEVAETNKLGSFAPGILDAVRNGTPLLAIPQSDTLSDGLAQELAAAGAFTYNGAVGDFRAPWMGNWYFVREHALFEGMPVNCAMGGFYQTPGRQSNGLLIERAPNGPEVEVVVGYSRDHDRKVGAGTFTAKLGNGKVIFHRVPPMHPVMQQRFLANALRYLTSK
ncbi:Glycosyl hydrolases family 2, sugar binding domain [Bryocella elongata]|uniref:Glycosyl hydrolases family 2, sugar binding domain n=1 Tax=Bryocella elongata TaxID=863522 RepID=A0A1H5STQ8_9BACT|nr:sugar-binding domain-containing protein [Bryocella elongata]SEF53187.1 Glycosyl hydrolases family 2, sugar binding domain [Bryocella elongata]